MKRDRERRRLAIRRETLRRLAAGDLTQAAGGLFRFCTYHVSGCVGVPTGGCYTEDCDSCDCGGGGGGREDL